MTRRECMHYHAGAWERESNREIASRLSAFGNEASGGFQISKVLRKHNIRQIRLEI